MLGLTGYAKRAPGAAALRARDQLPHEDSTGSGFPGDPAAAVTSGAAVFPPGWASSEDALTEDERWELAYHDDGPDLTPGQLDALMAQLPPELRDDPEMADDSDPPGMSGVLGLMPRHIAAGGGFDAGGVADQLPPGLVLAAMAQDTRQAGLHRLNDDELVGLALAWRRLHSWATSGELAAVAELDRRRTRAADTVGDPGLADHLGDELAMAMTLTGRSADALLDFARALARLPGTRAALADGLIDQPKAYVLANELSVLDDPLAAKVERAVLARAPQQTTGQLRSAAKRAVLAADPAAAKKRREAAQRNARVEVWHEPSGTASLAGRDLPPVGVLAADQRLTALARRLKATGRDGTLDELRAQVYTALLLGHPVDELMSPTPPAATTPRPPGASAPPTTPWPPAASPQPAQSGARPGDRPESGPTGDEPIPTRATAGDHGSGPTPGSAGASSGQPGPAEPGGMRGSVNLTLPMATWLGTSDSPGDLAGLGPVPGSDARALAEALATRAGNRWCLTLTGPNGRAIAHGCTSTGGRTTTGGRTSPGPPGTLAITLSPLAVGECSHERETPGYHPTAWLRHALPVRQRTCSAPGCRRQAIRCDLDHTKPYAKGGRTCECGLAPLCRRHHRAKQTYGWKLEQPEPGVLVWRLPHGRTYRVEPDPYPD